MCEELRKLGQAGARARGVVAGGRDGLWRPDSFPSPPWASLWAPHLVPPGSQPSLTEREKPCPVSLSAWPVLGRFML